MEVSSLNSTNHYLCPREPNHKFDAKDRLIKHLSNCKLLKGDPDFFSCKYETYHLFVTLKDKEDHEKHCPTRMKLKDASSFVPTNNSLFKVTNPGFNPNFVPKKVMTGYYHQNKERIEREEQQIKTNKAKVRVNVADMKKDSIDGNAIFLYVRDDKSYLRVVIPDPNQELVQRVNADFGLTTIFNLHSIKLDMAEITSNPNATPIPQLLTSTLVGYVTFPLSSISSESLTSKLREELVSGKRVAGIRDRRENEYLLVGEDVRIGILTKYGPRDGSRMVKGLKGEDASGAQGGFGGYGQNRWKEEDEGLGPAPVGDKRHSGEMVGKGKVALVYLVKSDYYRKVADKSLEERRVREATDVKELEARRADEKRKAAKDEYEKVYQKCLILTRTNEGLKNEVMIQNLKLYPEVDSSSQVNVMRTNQDISNLKSQIVEQQANFTEELKQIKDSKMAEYMRILIEDLTKLNDKIIHYKNNILAYQENIAKVDAYNQDTQKMIDNYRVTNEEYKRQIEGCRDLLSKEKDIVQNTNKDQKKGVVLKKELSCHLCKSSYVSMVTKPCNHCLLCWSCFHAFVQNNLRNCLVCDERVDFCFKIKYI